MKDPWVGHTYRLTATGRWWCGGLGLAMLGTSACFAIALWRTWPAQSNLHRAILCLTAAGALTIGLSLLLGLRTYVRISGRQLIYQGLLRAVVLDSTSIKVYRHISSGWIHLFEFFDCRGKKRLSFGDWYGPAIAQWAADNLEFSLVLAGEPRDSNNRTVGPTEQCIADCSHSAHHHLTRCTQWCTGIATLFSALCLIPGSLGPTQWKTVGVLALTFYLPFAAIALALTLAHRNPAENRLAVRLWYLVGLVLPACILFFRALQDYELLKLGGHDPVIVGVVAGLGLWGLWLIYLLRIPHCRAGAHAISHLMFLVGFAYVSGALIFFNCHWDVHPSNPVTALVTRFADHAEQRGPGFWVDYGPAHMTLFIKATAGEMRRVHPHAQIELLAGPGTFGFPWYRGWRRPKQNESAFGGGDG